MYTVELDAVGALFAAVTVMVNVAVVVEAPSLKV